VRLARVVWKDETGSESEAAPVWNNGEKDNCLSFFSLQKKAPFQLSFSLQGKSPHLNFSNIII